MFCLQHFGRWHDNNNGEARRSTGSASRYKVHSIVARVADGGLVNVSLPELAAARVTIGPAAPVLIALASYKVYG